mgnify:FL=1
MNNPIRTFIAIDLCDEFKETIALIQRDLKELDLDISWVKRDNLHLTLKFLGNVAPDKIPSVIETFQSTFKNFPSFTVELADLGAFPRVDKPQILWVGLKEETSVLQNIADSVENNFTPLGFSKEASAFEPHITIGRLRSNKNTSLLSDKLRNYTFPSGIRQEMTCATLYKSVLSSQGPSYEELARMELTAN